MNCVYALTARTGQGYPEYINVSRDSDSVRVLVRSPAQADGREGTTAEIRISLLEAEMLADVLKAALRKVEVTK